MASCPVRITVSGGLHTILFFSQNNNRGGYNVGDKTDKASTSAKDQYNMVTSILILK